MPTIVRLAGAVIRIFADDHAPPHFHLIGPRSDAQVRLGTLEVLRGVADRRDLAEVAAWVASNPGVLEAEWRRLNERD
ncbi:MAG: DUF4160 domain-containing protein [Alphaproteobacteria bacterium]